MNKENLATTKSWPFTEAYSILKRINNQPKKNILFETGYGPSGLPHIGTFAEVARTNMVRRAFQEISDLPTHLITFSDDADGLRKLPDNIPNKESLTEHLGKPLTSIPDPFGTHESYGDHMNDKLREFLDRYELDYEFKSATKCYQSGEFDETLLLVLRNYEKIRNIILPILGEERRKTYSPFMPICRKTGRVLQAKIIATNADKAMITYLDEDGESQETKVTGGACKLQWRVDWAMRWKSFGVDYEMHGKDLTPSMQLSSKICKIIGGEAPLGIICEMFLDENGEKISKSKGNGITMDEWLKYAPSETLSYYLYQSPRKAKKLHFDIIPKSVDEYLSFLQKFHYADNAEEKNIYDNPIWHIHAGNPPLIKNHSINFGLLLNLASVCNAEDKSVLWNFIKKYDSDASPEEYPMLDKLVSHAVSYYHDFVKPNKQYRKISDTEKPAFEKLLSFIEGCDENTASEEIQTEIYQIGKDFGYGNLKEWFGLLYEVLLGQKQGPRIGSFFAFYGVKETSDLIRKTLVD